MRIYISLGLLFLAPLALFAAVGGATPATLAVGATVGEWKFDEGSGSAAEDSSPYANDGVVYGAEWVAGTSVYALHFDGTDASYVEVPNKPELTPSRRVAIDVWIRPDVYLADAMAIVYKGKLEQTGCYGERSYSLWLNADGRIHFTSTPEGENCQRVYETEPDLVPLHEWSHVMVDVNTWEGKVRIFVNDQLALEGSHPQEAIKVGDSPLRIGGMFRSSSNQFHFNGSIDEVKIETGDGSPVSPVGGIAELPAMAQSPAGEVGLFPRGAGWRIPGYAPLVLSAAVALTALALTGGAWYARRRWGR